MEKGKEYYKYIKALISLYDDKNDYLFESYGECSVIIFGECYNYHVAIGERGLLNFEGSAKTPNEIAYKALEVNEIPCNCTDYEKMRDKFLENNIDYVEELLNAKEFEDLVNWLRNKYTNEKLKELAIEEMSNLIKTTSTSANNRIPFLIAYFIAQKPKKNILDESELFDKPEFISNIENYRENFLFREDMEDYLRYIIGDALIKYENENITSMELKKILEYTYATFYYDKEKESKKKKLN